MNGERITYLDNAATSQKPQCVIDALMKFYTTQNANAYRGVYQLANQATEAYEEARSKLAHFIGASDPFTVIFTGGTTESINWIARGFFDRRLSEGDVILTTRVEHHANLIPFQELAKRTGATLAFMPLDEKGELDWQALEGQFDDNVRLIAIHHVSNVLGTSVDIKRLADMVHRNKGFIAVDGAQGAPHHEVDVEALDVDFYSLSAHKMLGPTGLGALYGKRQWLEEMEPQLYGGEMITHVGDYSSEWAELPFRLEGGTRHLAGGVAFGSAIDYLSKIGMKRIMTHQKALIAYLRPKLEAIPGLTLYGDKNAQTDAIFSFSMAGVHPHDIASILDAQGVAIRAGHHCAQPLMRQLGVPATARASFYFYNTREDADRLLQALEKVKEFF
ncbi:SufS family cysteine desulfurase [Atopobacter sp. AH10]|nr:SufS family cysteine desulfurase [Atopobacter sp. AH10]